MAGSTDSPISGDKFRQKSSLRHLAVPPCQKVSWNSTKVFDKCLFRKYFLKIVFPEPLSWQDLIVLMKCLFCRICKDFPGAAVTNIFQTLDRSTEVCLPSCATGSRLLRGQRHRCRSEQVPANGTM